jgi:hypothetical protein
VTNSIFEIIDLLNWSNAATIVYVVDALRGNAKTRFLKLVNIHTLSAQKCFHEKVNFYKLPSSPGLGNVLPAGHIRPAKRHEARELYFKLSR